MGGRKGKEINGGKDHMKSGIKDVVCCIHERRKRIVGRE